jgi:hypothetical protein
MYVRYQESLRNPNNPYMKNHFMNRKLKPITDDIFSQMPSQTDNTYDYDSFCVPDDQVSFHESKS